MRVYYKNTNVDGNKPAASAMTYGELAVNYNTTNPRLMTKDSSSTIVSFLPESKVNSMFTAVNNQLTQAGVDVALNTTEIENLEAWINVPITDSEITKLMTPEEITFSVSNGGGRYKTYQATKGMTWERWINSNKYDIISPEGKNFFIQDDNISVIGSHGASYSNLLCSNDRTRLILKTDKIIENHEYYYRGEK